jgi:hypothetical protein
MRRRNTDSGPVKRRVLSNKSKVGRATLAAPTPAADLPGMQQIVDWLKQLGMHEYIQHFVENDIDFAILDNLTDQDLEKIGVRSLGHRRKLLRDCGSPRRREKLTHRCRCGCTNSGAASGGHRRAPSGHSGVLGHGRLNCTFRPNGPGRSARGHFRLSEMRYRYSATLRRLRSEVYG